MHRGTEFLLVLFCATAFGEAYLVKDGHPRAQIVVSEKPPRTVTLAAAELSNYVEKMSGAKLPIVTRPKEDGGAKVYVGRSPFTDGRGQSAGDLDYGAFRMVSGPDWLILLGRDGDFAPPDTYIGSEKGRPTHFEKWDELTGGKYGNPVSAGSGYSAKLGVWNQAQRGSLNAVYAFLRTLGMRWYFPGELGQVTPKLRDIAIPTVDRTVRPDFPIRRLYFYYNTFRHDRTGEDALWQMRLGLNAGHESFGCSGFGHGLRNVHGRDKSAPTMFALFGGKRSVESHWGQGAPCLSSEALFQSTVKYARAVLDVYPDEPVIDIAPVDGYASLCQCERCKDQGTPERGWNGRMSDYVWTFINRVAIELQKTHPGRKVNGLAYSGFQQPPRKIGKLSPNVSLIICRWRANFIDPMKREEFRELTDAWLTKLPSKELYIWDYYLHSRPKGSWEGIPVYFPHIVSDDLKFLKGKSKGDFIEVSRNWPAWGLKWHALAANHLNVYVTARLYWDADQDVGALLAEYYEKFYGPAAREMEAFIGYAETNSLNAAKDVKTIDRLAELLTAARKAAGDTVYGRRVQLLVDYMVPLRQRRPQLAVGRKNVPKVRAYFRPKADLKLDGRLDEPFWQEMAAHSLRKTETGEPPAYATSFKVAWAEDSLYFGIVCQEADTKKLNIGSNRNEDTAIFEGDSIELLLETQSHAYYQIAITPTGAIVDLDRKKGLKLIWSSQAEVGAHVGKDHWTLEVKVPVAGESQETVDADNGISGRQPSAGYPWYFNVCRQRMRPDARQLSAFSPTGKSHFHVPMKFAELYVK